MNTRKLLTLASVTVLVTAAVVYGGPLLDRPLPQDEAQALVTDAAQSGDTVALGRLAHRQCRSLPAAKQQPCYEEFFVELSSGERVRLALGALKVLGGLDSRVALEGHVYVHLIGIRSWQPGRPVGQVFSSCTGLFQSGCYHGVIQAYLTAEAGVDSARAATLCDVIEADAPGRWLRFQCAHGLGHGLSMIHNWDLPRALSECDWLNTDWDRQSCYGGAFMENAVASSPGGHHAPADLLAARDSIANADHTEHEGHEMGSGPPAFKMRDAADALYPCSIMERKYLAGCYQLQGGIILNRVNYDFEAAMTECDKAPDFVRHECYLSLGTNSSGFTGQNTKRSIKHCSYGNPDYQPWCFVGVAKNYVDLTAEPEDGMAFCREVPEGKNRQQCFVAVGEQIRVLHMTDAPTRERLCATAAEDGRDACRYGSALIPPPPGLPLIPGQP